MGTHTPGPWHARPSANPDESVEWEVNAEHFSIALVYGGAGPVDHEENAEDNARLIAKGPIGANLADAVRGLSLVCRIDVHNPCFDGRPTDVPGKHWGGGKACPDCTARAALAAYDNA
jgi:hypothetical protein